MTRAELRWSLAFGAALAALTSLPYLAALISQGDAWEFTGSLIAVEDGNSYLAKMRLGAAGDWLFRTPYSARPHPGIPSFLVYLLLGKLAGPAPAHRSLLLLYHALRVIAIPLAAAATYRFLAEWIGSVSWRRWATVVATLGGGLGWALLLAGVPNPSAEAPLEFHSPEAFGFLALFGIPHLILGRAMLLMGICWFLHDARSGRWGWRSGLVWLGLAVIQPLALVPAAAAVLAHGIARRLDRADPRQPSHNLRDWLKAAAGALILPAPFVLDLAIAYARDPALQAWAVQNYLPSPPAWYYLASYLPLLPLAGFAAWQVRRDTWGLTVVVWPLLLFALAYAPVGVQRRLIEGIWVALAALAAIGLERLRDARFRMAWSWVVLAIGMPSSLLLLVGGMQLACNPGRPAFRPAEEAAAFRWLAVHAPRNSVVLASFQTGNALPAWAPLRVVIGHGPETAGLEELRPQVAAFFRPETSDPTRQALLEDQDVGYVFHGPLERALGAWDPVEASYLASVYESADYAIFSTKER